MIIDGVKRRLMSMAVLVETTITSLLDCFMYLCVVGSVCVTLATKRLMMLVGLSVAVLLWSAG